VIKNRNSGSYYIYPLRKTPLEFLLDKEYLVSKINILEPREIDGKYLSFKIFEINNEINLFFDKKSLSLVGWQTEDIYQNLVVTFISSIKRNQNINNKIFILPANN
jgi:outer membrane lipoprotein-sorting protein